MQTNSNEPSAPFFTAPPVVVWFSGLLIAAHGLRLILPGRLEEAVFYWLALIPQRLALMLDSAANSAAYSLPSLGLASVGHAFLHADWVHVLVNTGMLLALGAPVARRHSAFRFLVIFFVSAAVGALVFFALRDGNSAPAIGASGGVSGILAAAFMLMAHPRAGWPELVSRQFLQTSAAFVLLNVALAFVGPSLFGAAIAWDAHLGGYVGGALAMAAFANAR